MNPPPTSPSPLAAQFENDGYLVVRSLLSPDEVREIATRFKEIHNDGKGTPGFYEPAQCKEAIDRPDDPLNKYPRVPQPHRFDELAKHYLLHPKVRQVLNDILGEDPLAVQSMFYFKPPGARGQELHQDQFYLSVEPGTCIAAWTAIDYCDAENGGMMVVPKTNHYDLVCPEQADPSKSFTKHYVKPPDGTKPVLVEMEPGDTLFFNGSVIHGSGPNRSKDRFRRSFICHYATGNAERISAHYLPCLTFEGREVSIGTSEAGGVCGEPYGGHLH
jgi:ectoine hydroxylase-related dioxygenase (phytanoyl-CoA dioxygenase family)